MAAQERPGALVRAAESAIQRSVEHSHQELVLQQPRFLIRTLTWVLIGTTGLALAWLALAQTEEVVVAPGKLEPIGEVKTVQMPLGGVLKQMLVKEGEQVKAGQVLLRLDKETSVDRRQTLISTIATKGQQLALKQEELRRYLNLNDTEQQVLRQNLSLEKEILARLEILQREGASAELQYLQQRNTVKDVEGQLAKTRADRLRQVAIHEQQLRLIQGELADLRSRLTEQRVTIRYQDVRSPVDGVVFDLKPTGPGFVGQGSEPVMKIVPRSNLEATVEIESSDIGFVREGKPVDISIDSFPASDFGVVEGVVKRIGSDALPPDERKPTYRFPAKIALKSQQLRLKDGKMLPLQVGMSVTANIKLRKVSYLQLLLGGFQDKTDSLRQI